MKTAILGISAYYHDSAAAILVDGEIVAAAQEERFTRKKHDASFPIHACRYVLDESGIKYQDLNAVAFYDKPFLKFERLLETYHAFAPSGFRSFLSAIPVWIKEKLFMRRMLAEQLAELGEGKVPDLLSRASLVARRQRVLSFSVSGSGDPDGRRRWRMGDDDHRPGPGQSRSKFSRSCSSPTRSACSTPLSPTTPDSPSTAASTSSWAWRRMEIPTPRRPPTSSSKITTELVDIRKDGSILLNMDYFDYATGLKMVNEAKWEQLFGVPRRAAESEISQVYMDMALAIQQVTEEIVSSPCLHGAPIDRL